MNKVIGHLQNLFSQVLFLMKQVKHYHDFIYDTKYKSS